MNLRLNIPYSLSLGFDPFDFSGVEAGEATAFWTFLLAIGTFLLVASAVGAAIFAWLTWRSTLLQLAGADEQLDMARQAKREREAENVSAWLIIDSTKLQVFLRNGNSGPVYEVKCDVFYKQDSKIAVPTLWADNWARMAVEPAEPLTVNQTVMTLRSDDNIPDYDDETNEYKEFRARNVLVKSQSDWQIWTGNANTTGFAVKLSFRDSAGIYWQRDWAGKLTERANAS